MAISFLQLKKKDKLEVILQGTSPLFTVIFAAVLWSLEQNHYSNLRHLLLISDAALCFDKQKSWRSCFFHLHNITKLKSSLSFKHLKAIANAFILSRVDFCIALYFGLGKSSLSHLQLVQNTAVRVVTKDSYTLGSSDKMWICKLFASNSFLYTSSSTVHLQFTLLKNSRFYCPKENLGLG